MELVAYTSEASDGIDGSDVFGIIAVAARNNINAGLTGVLFFKDGRFFQILEGSPEAIDALFGRLKKDGRHHSLTIISRIPTQQRYFPEWNMKRIYNVNAHEEAVLIRQKLASLNDGRALISELAKFFDDEGSEAA